MDLGTHSSTRIHHPRRKAFWVSALAIVALTAGASGGVASAGAASTVPSGFTQSVAFRGLHSPTALRFSPDGRVFVAEKSGLIKVFDGLDDTTPTTFADLRTEVHNYWDRGLLGMALDPKFPAKPYVYVLYTYDAAIGAQAPTWGTPGTSSDGCPTPPGPTTDGCVVSGRLSRLTASGDHMTGDERVLINDWCQQYPSHSVGDLAFGGGDSPPLYVSGGDGASFTDTDYGQFADNPCDDPPSGQGTADSPPSAEGGALRSESARRPSDEPRTLDGTILRVNPGTGNGLSGNPFAGSTDANARRILAYGLRNPFRLAVRYGTGQIWLGDVGWNSVEEIDEIVNPTAKLALNFGWPCYEGVFPQPSYRSAGLDSCNSLYSQSGAVARPFYSYRHANKVVPGESCPTGSSSTTGLAFYPNTGPYPPQYRGALFFADYSRRCIWVMERGGSSTPSPSHVKDFVQGAARPVDLQIGPDGNLYYADLSGGTIRKIGYKSGNQTPIALAKATPTSGEVPLTVNFDGFGSSDADGDKLSYSWDLNGDGTYGDSVAARPSHTYTSPGVYRASLRVTDTHGASSTDTVAISVGNTPPTPTITTPLSSLTWAVGDPISFSGSATDAQDGTLPASALSWSVILHHCPSNCHTHKIQDFHGVSSGSFNAPDHDYPSYLELRLTATDSGGLKTRQSVRLDPKTVDLTMASSPPGLSLALGDFKAPAPFTRTVILNSSNTISAPTPQPLGGDTYDFRSWSDGGAATHAITATASTTYTANYRGR